MPVRAIIAILLFLSVQSHVAQVDSLNPQDYKNRKLILLGGTSLVASGSLVYLNQQWYAQYNTGKFHFFNDNQEWLQMDKAGHAFTTYQTSRLMMNAFEWAGFNRKQTLFIGGTMGFVYMSLIEVMDGFSQGWGFSWGDMLANFAGTSLAVSQKAFWNDQRFQLKYSFSPSGLAYYNSDLLGNTLSSQMLKDYNAQTYWLDINPAAFLKSNTHFPKWLNVSLGYSAYGMLGGFNNETNIQETNNRYLEIKRQRRFYLSLDIDLTKVKTGSRFLRGVFSVLNILKIPAPAIELKNTGAQFYFLYY